MYNRALVLIELKQYKEAEKYYDRVLDLDPYHVNALNWKGILVGMTGDYKAALSYFDKALQLGPDKPELKKILENREFALKRLKDSSLKR